ncbi:Uncharacterised protein [Chlamydia trachomatis]|nr:Uncharacterised protein [Chlamydia trachomatis]
MSILESSISTNEQKPYLPTFKVSTAKKLVLKTIFNSLTNLAYPYSPSTVLGLKINFSPFSNMIVETVLPQL